MMEEGRPSGDSQEPILNPEFSEEYQEPSSTGLKFAVIAFVLIAGIAVAYGWLQHDASQRLEAERTDLRTALSQAKSQEDALAAKVNALSAAQAQEEAARAEAEAQAEEAKKEAAERAAIESQRRTARQAAARRAAVEDPRWKQLQQQVGDQQKALAESQKQIADTQADLQKAKSELNDSLQSTRSELGGDIARNHTELVALEKKGERNYYEFNFEKSKTYHHTGPLSISLRKTDSKHESCDLQMLVDDREITRKHVSLYESITLYPEGYPQPLEVVINHIDRDSIQGYVSEPKYRSTPASTSASASVTPPTATPPLEHRE